MFVGSFMLQHLDASTVLILDRLPPHVRPFAGLLCQVWSVILSSWSDVFDKMMNHDFEEKANGEVVSWHGIQFQAKFSGKVCRI